MKVNIANSSQEQVKRLLLKKLYLIYYVRMNIFNVTHIPTSSVRY